MHRVDEVDYRECIECGFSDEMRFKNQPKELSTRVNVTEEEKAQQTQSVKILDFKKNEGASD